MLDFCDLSPIGEQMVAITSPCRLQRACVHAARRLGGDGNGGSGVPATSGVCLAHAGELCQVKSSLGGWRWRWAFVFLFVHNISITQNRESTKNVL